MNRFILLLLLAFAANRLPAQEDRKMVVSNNLSPPHSLLRTLEKGHSRLMASQEDFAALKKTCKKTRP